MAAAISMILAAISFSEIRTDWTSSSSTVRSALLRGPKPQPTTLAADRVPEGQCDRPLTVPADDEGVHGRQVGGGESPGGYPGRPRRPQQHPAPNRSG